MNKLILLLLSFCPVLTFSQGGYEPFIVDGKVWYYDFVTNRGGSKVSYTYKVYFTGDTVIGGKNCRFLVEERPDEPLFVAGACYEEEGKVWMLSARTGLKDQKPLLLYDFSCLVGDTVKDLYCWRDDMLEVINTQYVFSFGEKRKMISLRSIGNPQKDIGYWLEGVGSRFDMYDIWPSFAADAKFLYCELNGEVIANQSSFGDAALETSDVRQNKSTIALESKATYDLQGRRVSGTPRPGIYIRNGRKVVVR